MPSLVTHHIFSNMVYKKLNKDIQKTFDNQMLIYNTFAQSHDYFYYSLNKQIKDLGHDAHHEKTQEYIITIVKEIKENKLTSNQEAIAYLYGAITHYSLDTICHPYIFYKTGSYHNNKETEKYHGLHTLIENELDALYYEKEYKKKFFKVNLNKEIIKKPILSKELQELITTVYKKVYNVENSGPNYVKSIIDAKLVNNLIAQDRFGIKKFILSKIKKLKHLNYYSNYIKKPNEAWLNNEHKTWNHPCNKDTKYNYSFDDLMNQALENSCQIISKCHEVLFHDKDIKILYDYVKDLDYATGYLIKDNVTMHYFEF